jgi:asparagine synthase (glutamine-hydrolysing)
VCGIVGFWDLEREGDLPDLRAIAADMTATMAHRGPDDEGVWIDAQARLALGHRRLSVVGLSNAGRQPMTSSCGRYVIVVNGELYNHREVRGVLLSRGVQLVGRSDSEVMLEAFAAWGVEGALSHLVGMFALALWDAADRTLHLVRDRLGEKPLYYGWAGHAFVFASELKALRAHPGFGAHVDVEALDQYLRYSYVPSPRSIYRGIWKLPAGTRIAVREPRPPAPSPPIPYWSLRAVAEKGEREPFEGRAEEAVERLEGLLRESVRLRMQADVPVGAFLSGGLDSSTVVSMMTRLGGRPVKTFTIGLSDNFLNEAPAARAVASHLGAEHTEWYVGAEEARDIIPALAGIYDEPFADASAIPVLYLSRLARASCTAVLAGDGGDELLGGYRRYALAASLWNRTRWLPAGLRRGAGWALGKLDSGRLRGIGSVLSGDYPSSIHWHLVSHWKGAGPLVPGLSPGPNRTGGDNDTSASLDFRTKMLYLDAVTLLPDDLLVKLDRASMAQGLEARLPFLDPAVVEFCFRLSPGLRTRRGRTKWVLRRVLQKYLPHDLIAVEKKGFAVPLGTWLRGPLRDWADGLISEESIRESGLLSPEPVRGLWLQHCSGTYDWSRPLWNVLMFQAWRRSFVGRPSACRP